MDEAGELANRRAAPHLTMTGSHIHYNINRLRQHGTSLWSFLLDGLPLKFGCSSSSAWLRCGSAASSSTIRPSQDALIDDLLFSSTSKKIARMGTVCPSTTAHVRQGLDLGFVKIERTEFFVEVASASERHLQRSACSSLTGC